MTTTTVPRVASVSFIPRACVAFAPNAAAKRLLDHPLAIGSVTRGLATSASPTPPRTSKDKRDRNTNPASLKHEPWKTDGRAARERRSFVDRRAAPRGSTTAISTNVTAAAAAATATADALDWRKAFEEFERGVHVHGKDVKFSPTDVFAVVKACVQNGRHREAQSVVRQAQGVGIALTPGTQAQMCAVHARKGNMDVAFETLTQVLTANLAAGEAQDTRLFDPILSVLKEQHDWQNIRRVVQLMHNFQIEPSVRVFRVLMISAAKARKKDVVLKTVALLEAKLGDQLLDVPTLTAMCQALTEVGETRTVLDKYHLMDQDWLDANGNTILLNNFVLAALRRGRLNKALEIFDRMNVSETFPPDDFTFATCILEFEKRGEWDQVIRIFNEVQGREMKGISHERAVNALTCAAIVRALHSREGASKHEIEQGMKVILQRLDRLAIQHFSHASSLVDVLEENGFRAEAQAIFARMVDSNVFKAPWLRQNGFEVDLHTFSRGVAKCAVVHAFQQARENAPVKKMDDMRVITGVGKRSKQYLQPVVSDDISQLLLRSFRPLIRPMQHPTNPGVLLIRSKFIKEWLEDGGMIRHFE